MAYLCWIDVGTSTVLDVNFTSQDYCIADFFKRYWRSIKSGCAKLSHGAFVQMELWENAQSVNYITKEEMGCLVLFKPISASGFQGLFYAGDCYVTQYKGQLISHGGASNLPPALSDGSTNAHFKRKLNHFVRRQLRGVFSDVGVY